MTTTTIRFTLARELVRRLRADPRLAKALIEPGWPGMGNLLAVSVWLDDIDGDYEYPFQMAGRKVRDDRFDLPFLIRVAGENSLDAASDRLGEVIAVLDDMFADDPNVHDFDGLMHALVSNVKSSVGETPDGPIGWGQVTVSPWARYL